ncbi:GerAB/ArcD/ProY family transporter [Paenibacillus sp. 598K]|uniref:GerAB/ArcD/ProY family transporter n=1 Tax=Paenibacillus sp. 598K TaxID=1117987 RepID=UPI0016241C0B|nr:endospore germination permease [Paenibacillus sp. 598K]
MKAARRIGPLQAAMLYIMFSGLAGQIMVLNAMVNSAKRDVWISALVASVFLAVWLALIGFIMRRLGQASLKQWLADRYGRIVAAAICVPLGLYLSLLAIHVLKTSVGWAKAVYMPMTPAWAIVAMYLIFAFAAAYCGVQAIAITAGILLPLSLLLSLGLLIINMSNSDFRYLAPMLEFGMSPVWRGALMGASGFVDATILLLLAHHMKGPLRARHMAGIVLILAVSLSGITIQAVALFGPDEAAKQLYVFFEEWRLVRIDKFIEHLDFLAVYQWLASSFIRLALTLCLLGELLGAHSGKRLTITQLVCCLTVGGAVLWKPYSDVQYFNFATRYLFPGSLIVVVATICCVALLSWARRGGKKYAKQN